jgi:hypothetical protein
MNEYHFDIAQTAMIGKQSHSAIHGAVPHMWHNLSPHMELLLVCVVLAGVMAQFWDRGTWFILPLNTEPFLIFNMCVYRLVRLS